MIVRICVLGAAILIASASMASEAKPFDAAAAFGARQGILNMSLSPDGKAVAYVVATAGGGSAVFTLDLAEGSKERGATVATGKPQRIDSCHWVSSERLVCLVYGVVPSKLGLLPFTRIVALDRSGGNMQLLSNKDAEYSHGVLLYGGSILDWLPDQDGAVLMSRLYLANDHIGSHVGSTREGLGVDLLDTRTLSVKIVEEPFIHNVSYISDGRGAIRIVGRKLKPNPGDQDSSVVSYQYRKRGSRDWLALGEVNQFMGTGFEPLAIDHDLDIAYGRKKKDGRWAIYSVALDGSLAENLVYARSDVDVTGLFSIGRRNRVVGVSYEIDTVHTVYFDPNIKKMMSSLSRALPNQPNLRLVDSSIDEQVLLLFAGSDDDPGLYYVFDRASKRLRTIFVARDQLEGVKLAKVRPVSYPATDGTVIPGYLTLPPGKEDSKALPAIVLPHGGPSARDHWGFDWLSQYFAARGFAVLQPNFRGSTGYGDAWLRDKGFTSWRTAIGDVLDAGHWLVAQGIADPAKLSVVGWSYGGYAALQSAVTEPGLFKAVVAIAPVTDLESMIEEYRYAYDYDLLRQELGDGPHVREASPARNADKITVPVLMFHGALDRNVAIQQSRMMAERLTKAGVKNELVTWDDLDHYLDNSDARTQMLRKADQFLRQAYGDQTP